MTRRGWLDEAPLLGENYSMKHVDSTKTTQRGWLDEGDKKGSLTVSGNGVIFLPTLKQTPPWKSLGGFHGLMLQKKITQNDYKIVTIFN